jgi:ribosome-associated protein
MADTDPSPSRLRLAPGVEIDRGLVDISFTTSSGPGGQNVNKLSTRCRLRVAVRDLPLTPPQAERLRKAASHYLTSDDELLISADEDRTQRRNRDAAIERLSELVNGCLRAPKVRRATKPSKGSRERRLREKKSRSDIKSKRRPGESHD